MKHPTLANWIRFKKVSENEYEIVDLLHDEKIQTDAYTVWFTRQLNRIDKLIEDGEFDPVTLEAHFPPHGIFKVYSKNEIFDLTKSFGVERLHFVATDGYTCHMKESVDKMDGETYDLYLRYHFKTCERQDLIGMSHHTLDVLRKEIKQ